MAEQLIESLSAEFVPGSFRDSYRDELLDLIAAKDAGEERVLAVAEGPAEDEVIDLMAALEASVAAAREARGRHPSTADDNPVPVEDAAPEESPAEEPAPSKPAATRRSA